jgi:hypothetical protein
MVSALFITVNAFSITPTVAPYDLLYERIGIGVKLLRFISDDLPKTESAFWPNDMVLINKKNINPFHLPTSIIILLINLKFIKNLFLCYK